MSQSQLKRPASAWTTAFFRIWLPTILLMLLTTALLYIFSVEPPPPKALVIAAGSKAGAYYNIALRYQSILRKEGIRLKIIETAGSIENLGKLAEPTSGIHLAFVQGGITQTNTPGIKTSHLRSLGSLYSEVMWVFYRGETPIQYITQLKGKRIGIGPTGSGTRPVTLAVLQTNGITAMNSKFYRLSSLETKKWLQTGKLDAAFFITSPKASYIQELLQDPKCKLMNFKRHVGYRYLFPYLSTVRIGQGQLSMEKDIPPETIHVLAPAATLVVRKKFPSSLVYLLMRTLREVHGPGNAIDSPNIYPSNKFVSFPMYPQAKEFLAYGPSWLQRNLPFWWATLIQRFAILGVSLLTLLYPLLKTVPFFYTWNARSRIYRWYQILRELDQKMLSQCPKEELLTFLPILDQLEEESQRIRVPLWHMAELYTLRIHINYLRTQISRLQQS